MLFIELLYCCRIWTYILVQAYVSEAYMKVYVSTIS
jgi:hypothetical protein